jgi:CheY-like chemotaxis protein
VLKKIQLPAEELEVIKITSRGLIVRAQKVGEGWLPASEWSWDPGGWQNDRRALKVASKIKAIPWGRSLDHGRPAFSRKRVEHNPWNNVTQEWVGRFLTFRVDRVTRREVFGEIEPGLQGRLEIAPIRDFISARDAEGVWSSHEWIALGDLVGGLVANIIEPGSSRSEPEIILDPASLLASIEADPFLLASPVRLSDQTEASTSAYSLAGPTFPILAEIASVLVVDNEEAFAEGAASLLRETGYEVIVARSEEQALEKIAAVESDQITIALIDLHLHDDLPIHNGLQVANALQQRHSRCRVILVTGEYVDGIADPRLETKILEAGKLLLAGYLVKPFTLQQLHLEIGAAMSAPLRTLEEILMRQQGVGIEPPRRPELDRRPTWRYSVQEAIEDLARSLPSSEIYVFQMHPLNGQGAAIASYGQSLN